MKFERLDKPAKYPGRKRVLSRDAARDYLFQREVVEHGKDPLACSSPVVIPAIGLPSQFEANQSALTLDLETRCRKCPECLMHRRRLWTARAVAEISASSRTWFGTLTVRPEERFRLDMLAEAKHLRAGGESRSSLTGPELFQMRASVLNLEATRFLKRVRSAAKGPLRYLLVCEAHKSGDPHLHLLVHERGVPITKRELEHQWRYGFSHWRLVGTDPAAAVYVCKYLAKDALTRVRASQRYGQSGNAAWITESARNALDALEGAMRSEGVASQLRGAVAPPSQKREASL